LHSARRGMMIMIAAMNRAADICARDDIHRLYTLYDRPPSSRFGFVMLQ